MHTLKLTHPQAQTTALKTLHAGGLVICPTETVYGALVDATNPLAVAKLLAYKRRPAGKAISIACAHQPMAERYVTLNAQAVKIYSTLLPGPVTVISQSRSRVVPTLESERHTLGIRLPAYPFLTQLVTRLNRPVTATSANTSGKKTPYHPQDVLKNLSKRQQSLIDLLLDAGTLPPNPPSLVIDTTLPSPTVVRPHPTLSLNSPAQTFLVHSEHQTHTLARQLLTTHLPTLKTAPLIFALDGPLGAGKTAFAIGLAHTLSIAQPLTSPTYTYLKQYPFTLGDLSGTLHHLDAWTIADPTLLAALEIEKLLLPQNLLVIEWFANLAPFFSPPTPLIHLTLTPHPTQANSRNITITS